MKALNSIDSSPNNQRNQSNNGNASCCRSVFDHYRVNYTDYEIAKDELNCFYQFKNRGLCQKYLLYHLNTKPFSGVVFLMTLNALVFLPGTTMAAIVYAFSDTPVYSFLLVKALIVICVANSAVFGSLYILERLFPTWKVYKRFLRMFKCLRVRATRIYTTNLTNDQKTRKFDDQSPDGNVDKPLHGLLATENEEDNNDDEMDDYLTNDEKRNRIHFSRNNAYQDQRKNNSHSGYGSMSKRFVFIQQFFVSNLMIINILFFIHTVIQEDCSHYSNSTFSAMFRNCRSEQIKYNRIDVYPLLFMFTPVLLSCIFRETLFEIQIANHFIVVLLGLLSTLVTNFNGLSIGMFCGWMIGGYCVLLDLHLHHVAAFLTSYKLREILLEKERNADQAAATEMRHMIGNVAHDLKTPLASFTTGLEIIADIIETNEKAIELLFNERTLNAADSNDDSRIKSNPSHHPSHRTSPVLPFTQLSRKNLSFRSPTKAVHGLLENNQGIKHCLQNIRDTNTFMLMTINRCIDYTKASRGFKLVPKYETLDLQETLRLPLDCMKNIQERIRIALKPIDMKEICSHIITDKQWLQENILCLLSNAVKYSTGGEVTIAVYLTEMEKIQVREPSNQQYYKDVSHDANDSTPFSFLRDRWSRQISESVFGKRRFSTVIPSKPSSSSASVDTINGDNSPSLPPSLISTREDSIPVLETALSRQKSQLYSIEEGNEKTVTKRLDSCEAGVKELDEKPKGMYPLVSGNTSATSTNILSHYIRFDVEDTGIGMSSEAMGQLFSPFRQAQRLAGGTGLGLYSLAKRVEAQNGSYGVMKRSDGKQGSLFWFAIPYRPDYTTADLFSDPLRNTRSSSYSNKREVRTKVMPDGSPLILKRKNSLEFGMKLPKLHILLVDDSPSIVKMSSMMLKRQGHVIEIADNGENALQCIQNRWTSTQRGFDIILMDLQMPVMDGLEATRRLRSLEAECPSWLRPHSFEVDSESSSTANKLGQVYEAWSRTYPSHSYHHAVIGVSANSDDETAREAIEAGVDAFLPKPFSMDLFNSTAMKVLSKIHASYTFSH